MIDWSSAVSTIGSAVKASISVILVLLYGYLIRKWKFISQEGENNISKLSVTWFLPSLLFSEIGPLATWDHLKSYWIIIVLSLLFQLCSWMFGIFGHRVLKMPQWIVPCLVFNNVTSLPLLLLDSLGTTGTLKQLVHKGDTLPELLKRGRVYFLINALVCNLTRFAFGPYLMHTHDPHIWSYFESPHSFTIKVENINLSSIMESNDQQAEYPSVVPYPNTSRETQPLLDSTKAIATNTKNGIKKKMKALPGKVLAFMNPPMWGGLAAVVAGLVPFLRHWLFDDNGWLSPFAQSITKLGNLYTVLQMFVLGAHLYSKKSDKRPPIGALLYLFVYRFLLMPVISNGVVFGMRQVVGHLIRKDPVLDFVLTTAPVGPPALTLAAIVEMSDTGEATEAAVAQTILFSYILTPLVSLGVSGSLAVVDAIYR